MTFKDAESLLELRSEVLRHTIDRGYPFECPPESFFFADYIGSQFSFFLCDGCHDDPETFDFEAGFVDPPRKTGRFSELVSRAVEHYQHSPKPFLWWGH